MYSISCSTTTTSDGSTYKIARIFKIIFFNNYFLKISIWHLCFFFKQFLSFPSHFILWYYILQKVWLTCWTYNLITEVTSICFSYSKTKTWWTRFAIWYVFFTLNKTMTICWMWMKTSCVSLIFAKVNCKYQYIDIISSMSCLSNKTSKITK